MAKSKALIAAEVRIAALEAQIAVARTCYRALRDSVRVAPHAAPAANTAASPTVSRYTDALGRVWIKTRTGNRASSRLATAADA